MNDAQRLAAQRLAERALAWRQQQSTILSRLGCPVARLTGWELAQRRLDGWA